MGKIPVLTNMFQIGWNHELDIFMSISFTEIVTSYSLWVFSTSEHRKIIPSYNLYDLPMMKSNGCLVGCYCWWLSLCYEHLGNSSIFYVHPENWGKWYNMIQFDEHIFNWGWNHQLVVVHCQTNQPNEALPSVYFWDCSRGVAWVVVSKISWNWLSHPQQLRVKWFALLRCICLFSILGRKKMCSRLDCYCWWKKSG